MKRSRGENSESIENKPRKIRTRNNIDKNDDAGYPLLRYANLRVHEPVQNFIYGASAVPRELKDRTLSALCIVPYQPPLYSVPAAPTGF